jgi:hypothetical protein
MAWHNRAGRFGNRLAHLIDMSTRYNNGSHYENHQRAAELQDAAAHAHRAGEQHGKQEHLTGHEQTRQALEHTDGAHPRHLPTTGHGITAFSHDDIAALAHSLWEKQGCPDGSAEQDWFDAVKELRSRAISGKDLSFTA